MLDSRSSSRSTLEVLVVRTVLVSTNIDTSIDGQAVRPLKYSFLKKVFFVLRSLTSRKSSTGKNTVRRR